MGYERIKVQNHQRRMVDGYLIDEESIQNGSVETEVLFSISEEALSKYAKNYRLPVSSSEKILDDYIKRIHRKIKLLFLEILERFTIKYRTFPSSIYPTKTINFVISAGNYSAHYGIEEDYKIIWIRLEIDMLLKPLSESEYSITHELYHIIAKLHELQDEQSWRLTILRDKLEKPIQENRAIVQGKLKEYSEALEGRVRFLDKSALERMDWFFGTWAATLWHWVLDGALCVIAIEISDGKYIETADIRDERSISTCQNILMILKDHIKKVEKERGINKEPSLHLFKVLQFITCFAYMPYLSTAYGVLAHSHKWVKDHPYAKLDKNSKSTRNIVNFRRIIKIYCDKEIAERFLNFFNAFLSIWEASAIHNDPLNPSIETQVHNIECQKKASYAYRVLNREFGAVMGGLKKFE